MNPCLGTFNHKRARRSQLDGAEKAEPDRPEPSGGGLGASASSPALRRPSLRKAPKTTLQH